jgi:homoserine dehydrogenase
MSRTVNIGLIGFGTVGGGVYNLIKKNRDTIELRTGIILNIKTICDLRTDVVAAAAPGVQVTTRWQDIVEDPSIETVVELIGGINPAKSMIIAALEAGKNVVTANKKLLAEAGSEIFALASDSRIKLGYEAAVGGGIPCIYGIKFGLVGNQFTSVMGILNGTTNYILTRMEEDGLSFDDALKEAQKLGFAEADPTFDIEGFDAGHKISLLAMLAFNKKVNYADVRKEGITKVSPVDIEFAREMGYVIKLLGICKNVGGKIDVRVHPTMIRRDHLLASVRREFNAVMFDGDMTGPVIMYGKGAGSLPTASAVVSDIIDITTTTGITESAIATDGDAVMLDPQDRVSRYYIRMTTKDAPGILSRIAATLAKDNISIASVVQKEGDGETVPLILTTHAATEKGILRSVEELDSFDFIKGKTMLLRIEDSAGA